MRRESGDRHRNPTLAAQSATDRLYEFWKQAGDEFKIPVNLQERGGLSDRQPDLGRRAHARWSWPMGDNDHCSERSADGSKLPEFVQVSAFVAEGADQHVSDFEIGGSAEHRLTLTPPSPVRRALHKNT